MNAQGEDVVAGIRTPEDISTLKDIMPEVHDKFIEITNILENHYKDMQDIEFTIEKEKLYILQTRNGKRTAKAAINIAVEVAKKGEEVILVRLETSPEDIEGMVLSQGVLTARGGMTSHEAVVARGMGKCCVAGCSEIKVDEYNKEIRTINDVVIKEGEYISIDGSTGFVYLGEIDKTSTELSGNFQELMNWVDEYRSMNVRTNADNPRDAATAVKFGAEGIGLCRTEHMFF